MNIKYRPDIDGLRSIAVLIVIMYHLGASFIPGGFIGVDVFFVISGFLITSIIHKDISNKTFSYKVFYTRRIKRLYPSIFTVISVSTFAAYYILLPDDLLSYLLSALATLTSVSNFYFLHSIGDYFSVNVEQTPLLHTWSLSVEEQYYLFAPIIVTLVLKFFSKNKIFVFFLLSVLLLITSIYQTNNNPASAYYMLPFRAFELMIGSLVAIIFSNKRIPNQKMAEIMSVLGIMLIISSSVLINRESTFPGINALWPCLGTALLISASFISKDDGAPLVNRFLSLKPFVYIGKISYPMYLWHWPIIAFCHYKSIDFSIINQSIMLLSTVILSSATFHFVENKVRYISWGVFKSSITMVASPAIIIIGLYFITNYYDGFPARFKGIEFARTNIPDVAYRQCYNSFKTETEGYCKLGDNDKDPDTIFIGDSMAASYIPFIDYIAKDAGISVLATASSALPPIKDILPFPESSAASGHRTDEKLKYNNKRIENAKKFKKIIISASWGNGDSYFKSSDSDLLKTVAELAMSGSKVYIIARPNGVTSDEFSNAKIARESGDDLKNLLAIENKRNVYLDKYIPILKGVTIINPNKILCTNRKCKITMNGQIIYFEKDHLNISGSRFIAKEYIEKLGNPLLDKS